jgi:hypothetical protein
MNKVTRKLFTYLIDNPPKTWISKNNGYELTLPTPAGQLVVYVNAVAFEVNRTTGIGSIICDRSVPDNRDNWQISNIEKNRIKLDRQLEKDLFTVAKSSSDSAYEEDVKFITSNKKVKTSYPEDTILGR